MNTPIQQLKKITLVVTWHDVATTGEASPSAARLLLYHGIAAEGLSGLEMALIGHGEGEKLGFDLAGNQLAEFFGSLWPSLPLALDGDLPTHSFACEVEILAVEEASQRELVQAMARSLSHGCGGGGCDCGCGGE